VATILLVEDQAIVRRAVSRSLKRHGYDVVEAENGRQALDLLSTIAEPDLIISDIDMPEMNGVDFFKSLQASKPELAKKFVFHSASEPSADLGHVKLLSKPMLVKDFVDAIAPMIGA
jgi:CheY-like chemotaxis protein